MARYKSLTERLDAFKRIFKKNNLPTPCKIWTGYTQQDGYVTKGKGYGRINLPRNRRSLKFPVHRVAKVLEEILCIDPSFDFYNKDDREKFFELYDAYSLCKLSIDHLCLESLCFNEEHLEWVHLRNNQKRKQWSDRKRLARIELISQKETRHHQMISRSKSLDDLVRKIQARTHRIKKE